MSTGSRGRRRRLRELADLAYRRELDRELRAVHEAFESWRRGEISPWDLSELIHKFHDGPNRELFVYYTRGDREDKVARAIAIGLLSEAEMGHDLRDELNGAVEFHRKWAREQL